VGKSYERALFRGERAFFVGIVIFRLVLVGPFDMLDRMDQVPVRNHGMMGRFFKFSSRVVLSGAALVLRRMLQKFGRFQMMIDALLRHVFRITKRIVNLKKLLVRSASRTTANALILARANGSSQAVGRDGKLTEWIRLKIAVLVPIPRAKEGSQPSVEPSESVGEH
jgi:hypothetical protein